MTSFLMSDRPAPSGSTVVSEAPTIASAPNGGAYEFLGTVGGVPVTWDACAPIRWELNPGRVSEATVRTIHEAVDAMEAASGFNFEFDGLTTVRQPTGAAVGRRGADLHVEIVPPEASELLSLADWGRTDLRHEGGRATQAVVALSVDGEGILEPGFGPSSWGGLVLHELGHVLGLDHVADPTAMMHSDLEVRPGRPGPDDLAGLAALRSRSSC